LRAIYIITNFMGVVIKHYFLDLARLVEAVWL